MPAGLVLAGRQLSWDEARDPDVRHFSVYGGSTADPDGSEVLIGYATGTSFDVSGQLHDYYHVSATDFSGNEGPPATVTGGVSGIPGAATSRTELLCNIPNPFNPATRIVYNLGSSLPVDLSIYDVSGRLVRQLERGGIKPAGRHEVHWDGRDGVGSHVAAGVYFYRLEAGRYAETKRMLLVK